MSEILRKIAPDTVVTLAYKVYNSKNQLVDQVSADEPFLYLHGHGNIVSGLENQLVDLPVGYKGAISVPNAYGERIPDLVQVVDRKLFSGIPENVEFRVGLSFIAQTAGGDIPVRVTAIDGDKVTVDANLQLAGETLTFDVEILAVRKATIEELAAGHASADDDREMM